MLKVSKKISGDGRPQYKIHTKLDWDVPGDIHLPFEDPSAVKHLRGGAGRGLFITGDLFDYYWLSSWPKLADKTKTAGYEATRAAGRTFVADIAGMYDEVVYGEGNHELRVETLSKRFPGFDGRWWWLLADILPKNWTYLDHGYRCEFAQKTTNGLTIDAEHGDRTLYGGVPTAERIVAAYPGQCKFIGHAHRTQFTIKNTWNVGQPITSMAYVVGHMCDIKKNNYANNPNWQQGLGRISRDGHTELAIIEKGKIL